jgi:hypothetical protein
MPRRVGSRTLFAWFCLAASFALMAPGPARAASSALLNAEQAREAATFVYDVPAGGISLTGFHCGGASMPDMAAFTADPDYEEASYTVGLEFGIDAIGAQPMAQAGAAMTEEASAAELRSPLSARLSRIIVEGGAPSLIDSRAMEVVSLPEASKSVADLMDVCMP